MRQTKIGLTNRQLKALKQETKTLGISMAELIRRILDKHLDEKR